MRRSIEVLIYELACKLYFRLPQHSEERHRFGIVKEAQPWDCDPFCQAIDMAGPLSCLTMRFQFDVHMMESVHSLTHSLTPYISLATLQHCHVQSSPGAAIVSCLHVLAKLVLRIKNVWAFLVLLAYSYSKVFINGKCLLFSVSLSRVRLAGPDCGVWSRLGVYLVFRPVCQRRGLVQGKGGSFWLFAETWQLVCVVDIAD